MITSGELVDGNPNLVLQQGSPTPTQLITLTATITPTVTATATLSTPVISTVPPMPTATLEILPTFDSIAPTEPTAFPITMTATLSPTATLVPFPSVTLVFPTSQATETTTPVAVARKSDWTGVGRLFIIAGLLVFWTALIAWFWYLQKRA